jgi:gliding motility-associated-like protein
MKKNYFSLFFFFISIFLFSQTPGTGTSPCSALQLYPQTSCGNTSGAQYAGYYQSENAAGANVTMTGTSTLDPACTPDNETTQAVEWLSVTATATTFTITNQTDYGNSPTLAAQEPHDFVIYSGPCGSLTQLQCFSNVAGGASVTATGLTVGQTYYIMVSQSASAYTACNTCTAASTCITSSVPFTPSNNLCSTPFNMTTNVQYTSTNANATADGPSVCQNPASGSVENNVWYQWCAPTNWPAGQTAYLIVNNQICNSTQGLQLSVYAPGITCTNITAGTATSLLCQNPGSLTNYNYSFTANPNQCYLITLDGFAGVACTYNIMVSGSLCAAPVLTATAASSTICSGNSTSLSAACSSNCGGISYSWAPSTGLSSTNGANVTASPTVTTTYTVTGTIGANCVSTQTVQVNVNPLPVMTSTNTATICSGTAINLNLTSNVASGYTWVTSNNANTTGESITSQTGSIITNTIVSTATTSTTLIYTVTPTSTAGSCPGTPQTVTVTVNPIPVMTSTTSASICSGSTLNIGLTSNVASSYSWIAGANANVGGESTTAQTTSTINNTLTNTTATSQTVTYTVTPTSTAGSCSGTPQTLTVTVNPLPNANAGSNQILTCGSPTVTLTGSSTSSPVSYSWTGPGVTGGANTATASANASGTYTLTVTNTLTGCSNTSTVLVSASAGVPNISMAASPTITCTNSVVTVSGSSTTSGVTYQWSSGVASTTSATTTVNAPGTYTLTVTDPGNGCTNSGTIFVSTSTVLPNANAGSNQTITCTTQTVTLSGSSTTTGVTYLWSPGGTTPNAASTNVTAAGTYTLTVTDPSNGCSSQGTLTVSVNNNLPNANAGTNQTVTCSTQTVTLSGSSTTSGVTYQWSPGGTTPTQSTTNVSTSGTYTLTVTDQSNGCTAQSIVVVNTNTTIPNANAGSGQLLTCSQNNVTLSGSSSTTGAMFSWEGPSAGTPAGSTPGASSTQVSSTGTYTLIVTDPSNGCTASSTVAVTPDANIPNVSAASNQTVTCTNTLVTISGSSSTPGVTYSWSPGGSTPTLPSTDVNASGVYTLTVTNPSNGCSASTTVFVSTDTASPSITIANPGDLTCSNTQVILNATIGGISPVLQWSGPGIVSGGNSTSAVVNAGGTYTLTANNNSNGCENSATVTIAADFQQPDANAGTDQNLTCSSNFVTLSGSSNVSGAIFSWAGPGILTGANSPNPTADVVGNYFLTVTNPLNGCSQTDTVAVIPDINLPNVNAGTDSYLSCIVTSVTLSGSSTNTNASVSWTGPGGANLGSNFSITTSSPGTYTLTVNDTINNCSNSDVVLVSDSTQLPGANAGNDVTLTCSSPVANFSVFSGTSGVFYQWNGPGGFAANTSSVSVTQPGNYTVTVTNPNTGCVSTDVVTLFSVVGLPAVNAGPDTLLTCATTSVTLSGTSQNSGVNYQWQGPSGFSSFLASCTTTLPGIYILTITDPVSGCSSSDTAVVNQDINAPFIDVSSSDSILTCNLTTVSLTAVCSPPNAQFFWIGPTGTLTGNPIQTSSPGTFTVTATNSSNGCVAAISINVTQNIVPPAIATSSSNDTINCLFPSISLGVNTSAPNYVCIWNGPAGFTSSIPNPPPVNNIGSYVVIITDTLNGCSSTDTVQIYAGQDPTVSFVATPTAGATPLNVTFTNTSMPGFSSYTWIYGDGNGSSAQNGFNMYYIQGTYTAQLIGVSSNGLCNDTADVIIIVYPPAELSIPNIFSPNGDGINEFFQVESKGLKDIYIQIFDRWGLRVATIDGFNGYWDGVNATEGTYYYVARAEGYDGKVIDRQGYLMLVR